VNASDWETIRLIHLSCSLYAPPTFRWTLKSRITLMRQFIAAYRQIASLEHVKQLRNEISAYDAILSDWSIRDRQVVDGKRNKFVTLLYICEKFFLLLILVPLSLPGAILNSPVALFSSYESNKLAGKGGKDVIATYKLIITFVLLPLLYIVYTIIAVVLLAMYTNIMHPAWWVLVFIIGLPTMTYATVRVAEEGKSVFRSFVVGCKMMRFGAKMKELANVREELVEKVRSAVEAHAPDIPDEERVIPRGAVPGSRFAFRTKSYMASAEDRRRIREELDQIKDDEISDEENRATGVVDERDLEESVGSDSDDLEVGKDEASSPTKESDDDDDDDRMIASSGMVEVEEGKDDIVDDEGSDKHDDDAPDV
jgi:hypothetical protein